MTTTPKRKAAIYARLSTEAQNPRSCEDQLDLCRCYADAHGFTIVATFEDRAKSGADAVNRDGYQALLAAARSARPPFDVILAESTDRLWRDMAEQQSTLRRLRLKGIEVIAVSQGIASRSKGADTQLAVSGLVSQLWIDAIRAKTHRGLEALALRGISTGGRTFSYKTIAADGGKAIAIDEAEAAIVRRIWKDYSEGRSLLLIAHRLNAERVPFPTKATKRGPARKGWSNVTVRFILRNERYTGRVVWNKREFLKDPDSGKRRSVLRPASEWRVEDRPDLRIVPPDSSEPWPIASRCWPSATMPGERSNDPGHRARRTRTAICSPACCGAGRAERPWSR